MNRVNNWLVEKEEKMENSINSVITKAASQKKSNVVDEKDGKCGSCSKETLTDDDDAIQCEICDTWYHIICIDTSVDTYNILSQDCVNWFCNCCNKRELKLLKSVVKKEETQSQLESEQKEARSQLEVVKEGVCREARKQFD